MQKRDNFHLILLFAVLTFFISFSLSPVTHSFISYTSSVVVTAWGDPVVLYAHQEQILLGGSPFYLLKSDVAADSGGITLSVEADLAERKLLGRFVFQLTGVSAILASNWTVHYRVMKTLAAVEANCDIDVRIRESDGSVREIIATEVTNSQDVGTSWETLNGTYLWSEYSVVDQTDYLEIRFYADITYKKNNEYVNLRVDDNTLALADQTRIENVFLALS